MGDARCSPGHPDAGFPTALAQEMESIYGT